jgi:hypothetical protein
MAFPYVCIEHSASSDVHRQNNLQASIAATPDCTDPQQTWFGAAATTDTFLFRNSGYKNATGTFTNYGSEVFYLNCQQRPIPRTSSIPVGYDMTCTGYVPHSFSNVRARVGAKQQAASARRSCARCPAVPALARVRETLLLAPPPFPRSREQGAAAPTPPIPNEYPNPPSLFFHYLFHS